MSISVEVLGSEAAWPSASRACTGFLIEADGGRLLIDCGTGIFERLRAAIPPEEVGDIVVSHPHFDHIADLIPFRYYLAFEARPEHPPKLHLPPGASEKLRKVVEPIDPTPGFFTDVFDASAYDPERELRIGSLSITFHKTRHPVDTFAMRLTSEGGETVVYSADTGWLDSLAAFAEGADLFICEATWADGEGNPDIHLSAPEAGRLASMAGAKKLALTHVAEPLAKAAADAARKEFEGPVEHAAAGSTLEL
ncbi:MAG: MBL fold metallo-hydrolase [Rubrobacter sp.]|nr:MBL fold metallo-hydrolase [Rubrobacter sp.]